MLGFALRKTLTNLIVCLVLYALVARFSQGGQVYAGWLAGVLGACYLLAGWLAFLRTKGSRPFQAFRRKYPPEVPDSLKNPGFMARRRRSLFGLSYLENDSLREEAEDDLSDLPEKSRFLVSALIYTVLGVAMLILSGL